VRELAYASRSVVAGEPVRDLQQDPYTGTEVAFALSMTEHAAGALVSVALTVVDRCPALLAAMRAGRLDLAKAKVFTTELADATNEVAQHVVARLLPEVDRCTTGQLGVRIRRLLARLDPQAMRERHRRAVEARAVEHHEYANGTATVAGIYLPKQKAAAAWDNIDALARATKSAGDPLGRTIDQIRADVFADLLAGVDPRLPLDQGGAGAATPATRQGVLNLHIGVTTLACLDDNPGVIPGFGDVIADIARQTAAQMAQRAQWRFTVFAEDGDTLAEGRLKSRPWLDPDLLNPDLLNPDLLNPTGGPVDRRGYRPTAAQRAFVNARDRTCRAPGCRRPAQSCEQDHTRDWLYSRDTSVVNLCCLCKRHHRAKHQGRFRVRRGYHGIDWTTPLGRVYTVLPEDAPEPNPTEYQLAQQLAGFHGRGRLRR